jgi:hypothetical protein
MMKKIDVFTLAAFQDILRNSEYYFKKVISNFFPSKKQLNSKIAVSILKNILILYQKNFVKMKLFATLLLII